MQRSRSFRVARVFMLTLTVVAIEAGTSSADEIWVMPTYQNGACAGPFAQAFTGVPNQLVEVDISSLVAPRVGTPCATYLSVVAYTSPNTATDHFVGLRFSYSPQ